MTISKSAQPDICCRPACMEDLSEIVPLEQRSHSHPWSAALLHEIFTSPGYRCVIATHTGAVADVVDKSIIGFAVTHTVADEMTLLNIVVREANREQGVGRHMLRQLLAELTPVVTSVYLEVRVSNFPAIRLYCAEGFEQVGTRRDYYPAEGGREDALVLRYRVHKDGSTITAAETKELLSRRHPVTTPNFTTGR